MNDCVSITEKFDKNLDTGDITQDIADIDEKADDKCDVGNDLKEEEDKKREEEEGDDDDDIDHERRASSLNITSDFSIIPITNHMNIC